MIEINLLPWREQSRLMQKKLLMQWGVSILALIFLFSGVVIYLIHQQKKAHAQIVHLKSLVQTNQPVEKPLSHPDPIAPVKQVHIHLTDEHKKLYQINMQDIELSEALYLLAQHFQQNIIVSPHVTGRVTLTLNQISLRQAFEIMMSTQNLAKLTVHHTWMVASPLELIQIKKNRTQWKSLLTETMPLVTHIFRLQYAKAGEAAHLLQGQSGLLSPRGSVQIDERTNQLIVHDHAISLTAIEKLMHQIDIPLQQVSIETRLVSMDADVERELGVDFSLHKKESNHENHSSEIARYSLAVAKLADGSLLDMRLAAAENTGHAELISAPRLFTANRQTASIEAGEEIPYQEISSSGATGVTFKKAVLSLQVTPHILPGHRVLLELQIHQDKPASREVLGVPAITTRQLQSSVLIQNGQTIVLGGIFEDSQRDARMKIPFLSAIPGVGLLFQQQILSKNHRELLIFVTPHIYTSHA
ncbi:MAG: secretin N-terminal domain-containing protein [Gammaproteobacteria bacterium]|nr:secretin N-terminal domain-containing protein [Gammaproteobacteria bacterium]